MLGSILKDLICPRKLETPTAEQRRLLKQPAA